MGLERDVTASISGNIRAYKWLDGTSYDANTQSFAQWATGNSIFLTCACVQPLNDGGAHLKQQNCDGKAHTLCRQRECMLTFFFCVGSFRKK